MKNKFQNINVNDTISLERVAEQYENMKKEEKLKEFCDIKKIKYRDDDERYYIIIKRKQYSAKTKKGLLNKLYITFCGDSLRTLTDAFEEWMHWRNSIQTNSKTMRENLNEWNLFVVNHKISTLQVAEIDISDWEEYFYQLTMNYAINSKRLSNILSVLNGIMKRCVSLRIVEYNILNDVDMKQFRRRCKPAGSTKENYSLTERNLILAHLKGRTDVYSLAIQLSFYLCLRIGELVALKYSDVSNGLLFIQRSQRTQQIMNDDFTFDATIITNEERIKGHLSSGFRTIPLTPSALAIIEKTNALYPDQEFLFMRNDKQLLFTAIFREVILQCFFCKITRVTSANLHLFANSVHFVTSYSVAVNRNDKQIIGDTFNEALRKTCKEINIPYRSSHQIRFTVATLLYENGIPITQLSTLLGHADTNTTWHYIRQQKPSLETIQKMSCVLE